MIITTCLIVLAVLAYLGRSLVMLTSVGGIAVALWLARRRTVRTQVVAAIVAAVVASVAAEAVHVVYHAAQADPAEHGGFWVSALLVGLINAAVMLRAYVLLPDPSSSRAPRTFDESGIYVQFDSR